MDKPFVTIITPTFNAAHWLPETIESILSQDYTHLEYLILDDGSTDNTQSILDKYRSDPRVHVFYHPNMGEVHTINKGYQLSHGLLLGNVSADDPISYPGWLHLMVQAYWQNKAALVFYPDFHLIDKNSRIITGVIPREWDYEYMVSHHYCTPGPGALMRREVLNLVGLRNPDPRLRWVADLEYWLRIGQLGAPMQHIPYFLATHRRHPEQLTVKMQGREMAAQHIYLYEQYFARLASCSCQENNPVALPLCHHNDNLWKLKPQAMAYTYLTCAYVCPGDYSAMAQYISKAIRAYPPIAKDIGQLLLAKGAQIFLHRNGS